MQVLLLAFLLSKSIIRTDLSSIKLEDKGKQNIQIQYKFVMPFLVHAAPNKDIAIFD